MAEIDVVIEDDRWDDAGLEELAERAGRSTLAWLGMDADICVMGCDDTRIAALNADFRGKPRPTNVLSWPAVEHAEREPGAKPPLPDTDELGDIAISYDRCVSEAETQGKQFDAHVTHLLVHAMLHLAGYDHVDDSDAETMEAAERSVLAPLGISDPYQERDQ
ncbi:rRNA maturation RNase YbeY [Paracoccus aerodenitrificans]|uniref:rRNA maturation RNase YbeY n=1 Tax=Paracoccus aerodenitrificans TaxID=3017781 RepID=UPI0022F11EA0|nr:rRNA maturation RNase YbeY [Paracoccus aerodenitrificans]WBU63055.1 rRNA maturation RNase YbeY [Paracoccus aerodenitrificans]